MPSAIPQTDPRANYLAHRQEIDAAISDVLQGGYYILGKQSAAFEREFAAYLGGASQAVGVSSGTDAIHLALRTCGIGPGDSVITVSHTAVATVAAIELAGAAPVLIDVDPATFTMDPNALEEALRKYRARAVIPVHLYGHPADMPAVMEIARRHELHVIEDCAQSHGASIQGRKTGCWGDMAAFSFYPTKNLGALGDGGAVATGNRELAGRARLLREYGWRERYVSEIPGMNTRLDELQAAILRVKLRYLDTENGRRRELAARYDALLAEAPVTRPRQAQHVSHVYHQYAVLSTRRDDLRECLRQQGIGTLVHYPVPVHLQPAYRGRIAQCGALEKTEAIARQVLSLPMYPELAIEQLEAVAHAISACAH